MIRHKAFSSKKELEEHLATTGPQHVYHSSAYYTDPGASTMVEKGWTGADLIFDLDGDKIPSSKGGSYEELLDCVKDETLKLIDFLTSDFGFAESDMKVVFSGCRGYHIHIRHDSVLRCGTHERREIVDYICGTGLDLERILRQVPLPKPHRSRLEMPPSSAPGWGGRLSRWVLAFLRDLEKLPKEEGTKQLETVKGIGERYAQQLWHALFESEDARGRRGIDRIAEGKIDLIKGPSKAILWKSLLSRALTEEVGHPDEPVTADIKRLIRLPGSLHGGTGLRVTPIPLNKLDRFDPLLEAIAFSDELVQISVKAPVTFSLGGEHFDLERGEGKIPQYAAIYLLCRGEANEK